MWACRRGGEGREGRGEEGRGGEEKEGRGGEGGKKIG